MDTLRLLWESMQQENLPDPVYGADTEGSLYDDDVDTLNISRLGTILDDLKKDIVRFSLFLFSYTLIEIF